MDDQNSPAPHLIDIDVLHQAVAEMVVRTNVRAVAEEIGISSSRLNTFLNGKPLGPRALLLLSQWYRNRLARGDLPSAGSPSYEVDLEVLRVAVQTAVHATSIRAVAAEVGVPKSLVEVFLRPGNKPRERTVRAFQKWYAARQAT
jgi:hypothetical protein